MQSIGQMEGTLTLTGAQCFRMRLILATLTQRRIRITEIRSDSENPGVQDFEVKLLKLLEIITNGSKIEINDTGTEVYYQPGFITGGDNLSFDCGLERAIGYYLEALVALIPFGKAPIAIELSGIVNDDLDISPDIFRVVTLPFLSHFGIDEGLECKINKRGAPPLGGGMVYFRCSVIKQLKSIDITDPGKVKKIRGVAYTTKVNPTLSNRVVTATRELFNHFIPDVWIFTDHNKGPGAGNSPGYALSLIAESSNGCLLSTERIGSEEQSPEDLGVLVSRLLCDEIAQSGCIDSAHQGLVFLLMALCPEDVSTIRTGKLTPNAISTLRHVKKFLGVTFKVEPVRNSDSVMLKCRGSGYFNYARNTI